MKCFRLTKGIYYFEDVFSSELHISLHENVLTQSYELDERAGSVQNIHNISPVLYGMIMVKREEMFNYLLSDDEEMKQHFKYDKSRLDWLHVLAKGPQHPSYSQSHIDNDMSKLQYGIIYYPHLNWEDSWGGELKLGDSLIVSPKPNSAIMFPSHLPHTINPININAESWRYTIFARTTNTDENNQSHGDLMLSLSRGIYDDNLIQPEEIKILE